MSQTIRGRVAFCPEEAIDMGKSRAMAAPLIGPVIGGIAGYLFFTEHGRTMRRQIEPALDDIARELNSFRSTVQKAARHGPRKPENAQRSDG